MKKLEHTFAVILLILALSLPGNDAQFNGPGVITQAGAPKSGRCANSSFLLDTTGNNLWFCVNSYWMGPIPLASGIASVPSGAIVMIASGSCPGGFTENDSFNASMALGTEATNGDAGTTGGSNTVTPTGSNAVAVFTPVGTVAAPVFTGDSNMTSSVSAGTPAGSNSGGSFAEGAISGGAFTEGAISGGGFAEGAISGGSFAEGAISWPVGVPTNASGAFSEGAISAGSFSEGAISWPAGVPTNASGSFGEGAISYPVNVPAFTGAALAGHTHTLTPTGTNGTAAWTIVTGGYAASTTHYSPDSFGGSALASGTTSITVPAEVFTGALDTSSSVSGGTPSGTIAWPANPPTIASGTFVQPTISWPVGVPTIASGTFTQPAIAAGTFTQPTISWPVGVPTIASGTFTQPAIAAGTFTQPVIAAGTFTQPVIAAGTFTQPTFSGNALAGHVHTVTSTGTNSVPAFTGNVGTVPAEIWTGNSESNLSAYVKVIFCQKS